MKNFVKKTYVSTKKFVVDHKFGIGFTTGAVCVTVVHLRVITDHNNFLKDHGLYEEYYYTPED